MEICLKNTVLRAVGVLILTLVAACSEGSKEKVVAPNLPDSLVTEVEGVQDTTSSAIIEQKKRGLALLKVPAYPNLNQNLIAGETFNVALDDCELDDSTWIGQASDPYGRLKCGENYSLKYNSVTSEWISEGVDEYRQSKGQDPVIVVSKRGGVPTSSAIYIWGVRLYALEDGRVFDAEGLSVGHISIN